MAYQVIDFIISFLMFWVIILFVVCYLEQNDKVLDKHDKFIKGVTAFVAFCITWLWLGPG